MEEEYGAETFGGDYASMVYGEDGQPITEATPSSMFRGDGTGTKIDYSSTPPIPFQKTATIVNYFITNTAQFLNTFSQVAETKLHEVDNKLDEIE